MHVLPTRWAIWSDAAADGLTNMATDAALLDAIRPGVAVWRWYAWQRPTVSFGRNEAVRTRFSDASLAAAGLDVVRRPTGGRALLHAREITYSVTCPLPLGEGWRLAYAAINAVLLGALTRLGVAATLAGQAPAIIPDGPVCFESPAEGEITVDGRKLVGSAVWRQGAGYLQHGSILLHDDQARIADAALMPLPPAPPAAELARIAPGVNDAALRDAVAATLRTSADVTCEPFLPSADVSRAITSHRRHFADPSWLWRR